MLESRICGYEGVEGNEVGCYNRERSARFGSLGFSRWSRQNGLESKVLADRQQRFWKRGQVAQVVERSPEKAGVGGSTPSLATIIPKDLPAKSRNFQPTIQPMILTELAP